MCVCVCVCTTSAAAAAGVHEATIGLAGFVLALRLYYYYYYHHHYVLLFFIAADDQLDVIAADVDDDAVNRNDGAVWSKKLRLKKLHTHTSIHPICSTTNVVLKFVSAQTHTHTHTIH